jgi:hypothetical protein
MGALIFALKRNYFYSLHLHLEIEDEIEQNTLGLSYKHTTFIGL